MSQRAASTATLLPVLSSGLGLYTWQQALPVLLADHPSRMAHWHPRLHDKRHMTVEHVCRARRMVVRRRGQGPLANAVRDMFMPMVVAPWCTLDVSSGALPLLLQMADVRVRRKVQPERVPGMQALAPLPLLFWIQDSYVCPGLGGEMGFCS